jgi:hypothetical protein
MRVLIEPHNTTEFIVATVKSFFDMRRDHDISFEDEEVQTLSANYENFSNNILVNVCIVADLRQNKLLTDRAIPPTQRLTATRLKSLQRMA